MSKTLKRALMGGALGALQGAQQFFQTQRAQEAERLKEERLAAIRASERAEDRAFQTDQTNRQIMAQAERDDRLNTAQLARDERQAEIQAARDAEQRAHAMKIAGMQIGAQRDATGRDQIVVVRTPEGGIRSMSLTSEELKSGLPPGYSLVEGRAGTRFEALPTDQRAPRQSGSTPAEAVSGGAGKPDVLPGGVMADESVDDGVVEDMVMDPVTGIFVTPARLAQLKAERAR